MSQGTIKSAADLAAMRRAGRIVAEVLERLAEVVRPGITTADLDAMAEEWIRRHGARPAFKGYRGFPASICASVNDQVVHGIPGDRALVEGDIISIDVGVALDGFYADAATTVPVGAVSDEDRRLLKAGCAALDAGIAAARAGARLSDVGHAVEQAALAAGFSVVREYVGHGIGRRMHEAPHVPNYGPPGCGPELQPGMTLAIEPMLNAGAADVAVAADQWTVVTRDGSRSVHFEHTIAVTEGEPEVLTRSA